MLRIKSAPFLVRNSTPKYIPESYNTRHHYGIANLTVKNKRNIILSEVNEDFLQLTGQVKKDIIGSNLYSNPIWSDKGQLSEAICNCLKLGETQVIDWVLGDEATQMSVNCSIVPFFDQEKKITSLTLVISNNSADIAFANHIQEFNYYDNLTGLPNKNYLHEMFDLNICKNFPNGEIAFLLINILQFQRINESFGYEFGDAVILQVAARIQSCLPSKAILTRFEGDKFSILIADKEIGNIQKEVKDLAENIHHKMGEPIRIDQQDIHIALSIGIAMAPTSSVRVDSTLIQQAHIAMRRLKTTDTDRTLIYQPDLQIRASSRLKLENELREAIKNNELCLAYQPIVGMQNGRLIGFEALCRWNHPERGLIYPIEFIPLSEESGLIIPLGDWVLQEACRSLRKWIDKYPVFSHLVVNVNVSALQLLQEDFITKTKAALLANNLQGEHLKLEITETTLVENADLMRDILLDLKTHGIFLAIDDFGTGYSSLSYLNQFPVDTLKIDKSFINHIHTSVDSYKIIHIMSTLAHTFGMNLVAEGIEHKDQAKVLKKLGCHNGQGFLFSEPLSFEGVENYIQREATSLV